MSHFQVQDCVIHPPRCGNCSSFSFLWVLLALQQRVEEKPCNQHICPWLCTKDQINVHQLQATVVWFCTSIPQSVFWCSSQASKWAQINIHVEYSWIPFNPPRRLVLACIQNIRNVSFDLVAYYENAARIVIWHIRVTCNFLQKLRKSDWEPFCWQLGIWSIKKKKYFSCRDCVFFNCLLKLKTLSQNEIF